MAVAVPADAGLGIEEVVVAVDVEALVVEAAVLFVELIVDAVGAIAYVAILDVAEDRPLGIYAVRRLEEYAVVVLRGVGVVVGVSAVAQQLCRELGVGGVSEVAEVVAREAL